MSVSSSNVSNGLFEETNELTNKLSVRNLQWKILQRKIYPYGKYKITRKQKEKIL